MGAKERTGAWPGCHNLHPPTRHSPVRTSSRVETDSTHDESLVLVPCYVSYAGKERLNSPGTPRTANSASPEHHGKEPRAENGSRTTHRDHAIPRAQPGPTGPRAGPHPTTCHPVTSCRTNAVPAPYERPFFGRALSEGPDPLGPGRSYAPQGY